MEDKNTFIGKYAIITIAPNKSLVGLEGLIVDETKNTFVFKVDGLKKTVLKSNVTIAINEQTHTSKSKRIEERIKSR